MTKFYVLNLAVPGAILGTVWAVTLMSAHDKASKIWHRHSIAVSEADE